MSFSLMAVVSSAKTITIPIILTPETDLTRVPGHDSGFTRNIPTFDSLNRPYIRSRGKDRDETAFIHTLREGQWVERPFLPTIRKSFPNFKNTWRGAGWFEPRVVFDAHDRLYTQIRINLEDGSRRNLLLYSTDFAKTFELVELPLGAVIAEHQAGHNRLEGPPFLMIADRISDHEGEFASRNRLSIIQPRWEGGAILLPEPLVVAENLVGLEQHSGGAPFAATRHGRTHFAWAAVSTAGENSSLTPTWAATYLHEGHSVSEPVLLARTPPGNNAHNMPGLVMDRAGYLHLVTGAHFGHSFHYLRSKEPDSVQAGWSEPVPVWDLGWQTREGVERGGQTYVALVCDQDDILHLVFRHWRRESNNYPHLADQPGDYFAALAYQNKEPGKPWSAPVRLVVPPRNIYSIYYHRLSLDWTGHLFLSFSYLDQNLLENPAAGLYHGRMLWVSPDRGSTWIVADTTGFCERMDSAGCLE